MITLDDFERREVLTKAGKSYSPPRYRYHCPGMRFSCSHTHSEALNLARWLNYVGGKKLTCTVMVSHIGGLVARLERLEKKLAAR